MKVLFEVAGNGTELTRARSHFNWLRNNENKFFVLEDGRRMKILNSNPEPGQILYSESLNAAKYCTALAWNKDGSVLAMVIDRKKIFLWDIKDNKTKQHKTNNKSSPSNHNNNNSIEIDFVVWSKLSDRFVVCYSNGQLSIGDLESDYPLKFISTEGGSLERITSVECNYYYDLFVCLTKSYEVIVMNFSGDVKLYWLENQNSLSSAQAHVIVKAKTSRPVKIQFNKRLPARDVDKSLEYVWLAYSDMNNDIKLIRVILNDDSSQSNNLDSQSKLIYKSQSSHLRLVDFHWLGSEKLVLCYQSGILVLVKIQYTKVSKNHEYSLISEVILNILQDNSFVELSTSSEQHGPEEFISFELVESRENFDDSDDDENNDGITFFMAAMTSYQLYYYIIQCDHKGEFVFEKIDELNYNGKLDKLSLRLHRAEWSYDCSMLAVQLSNSHIIIYQTKIQNQMIVSNGSRVAFVSGPNEVSVINLRPEISLEEAETENWSSGSDQDGSSKLAKNLPLIIRNSLRPSVIAVGPHNLAIALNNRIQFYNLLSKNDEGSSNKGQLFNEQEYVSIVVAMSLSSRFVAIQFDDGRLKLHAIRSKLTDADAHLASDLETGMLSLNLNESQTELNERFFPDPLKIEQIQAFALTEKHLLYSTQELTINVFSIDQWSIAQTYDHLADIDRAFLRLFPNEAGNKFACLTRETKDESNDNAFIYDLFRNRILKFSTGQLYDRIFRSQLNIELPHWHQIDSNFSDGQNSKPRLNRIKEVVWDSDGRGITLIERKRIHNFTIYEHSLEQEEILVEYVLTTSKPSSYKAVWASQGILSFQTGIGRGVHTLLEPYNDELVVSKLEQDIRSIKGSSVWNSHDDQDAHLSSLIEIMRHKLMFLRKILPINSLHKCKIICENLTDDEQLNLGKATPYSGLIEQLLWRQLAARSLFLMNLEFALLIYRKHGQSSRARALKGLIDDWRREGSGSKVSMKTRLLVFLECN